MTLKNPLWQQLAEDVQNNTRRPPELCCPITHEICDDPVMAAGKQPDDKKCKWVKCFCIFRWLHLRKSSNSKVDLGWQLHKSDDQRGEPLSIDLKHISNNNYSKLQILAHHSLTPNLNLRSLIHKYKSSFGTTL